jgi:hypothetical protein
MDKIIESEMLSSTIQVMADKAHKVVVVQVSHDDFGIYSEETARKFGAALISAADKIKEPQVVIVKPSTESLAKSMA